MAANPEFERLMACLRRGDEDAACTVYGRFASQLTRLARSRLAHPLRSKLDAEDIVQSVFRSFFMRQRQGGWRLDDWAELEGLLAAITLHKCGKQAARFQTQRRNTASEVPLSAASEEKHVRGGLRRDPSPEELATLTDLLERLLGVLLPRDAEILLMRLEGYSVAEISQRTGRALRTVWRALRRSRMQLRAMEEQTLREMGHDWEACPA